MSKRRNKRLTSVDLILQAQARIDQARSLLEQMGNLDPRFADCFNELRNAMDARTAAKESK